LNFAFNFNVRRYTAGHLLLALLAALAATSASARPTFTALATNSVAGGLRSSTSQLNPSRFWSLMPQPAFTS
jgi:hypothetical protein